MSITDRLRSMSEDPKQQCGLYWELCMEAADEIERLERELAEREEAARHLWNWCVTDTFRNRCRSVAIEGSLDSDSVLELWPWLEKPTTGSVEKKP